MDSALAQWEEKENSTPDEEWAALQQVVNNTAKTPGIVRPQRPGATDTYEQKRPSPPGNVVNEEHYRSTTAAYKDACRQLPVH